MARMTRRTGCVRTADGPSVHPGMGSARLRVHGRREPALATVQHSASRGPRAGQSRGSEPAPSPREAWRPHSATRMAGSFLSFLRAGWETRIPGQPRRKCHHGTRTSSSVRGRWSGGTWGRSGSAGPRGGECPELWGEGSASSQNLAPRPLRTPGARFLSCGPQPCGRVAAGASAAPGPRLDPRP